MMISSLIFREGNGTPLQYSFAWRIPWTEEPGRLQSMGQQCDLGVKSIDFAVGRTEG